MIFLNPVFAWGFLALAVILALYLLKRKYETKYIPSTFLWKKAGLDLSASKPFQKLKKNILLPIQLLMAAVLVLALMRPVLPGTTGGEMVMIFDLSASMQAESGGKTRLSEAVEAAKGIIDGLKIDDALTMLAVDHGTHQLLTRSTDRDAARRLLNGLKPSNEEADLSGAISLAQAMEREVGDLSILVFSDDYIPPEGAAVYNAERGLENRAIVSFTVENGVGYARVANYGADTQITLACYAEGKLCDARVLSIPAGGSAGTTLEVPECRWAYVEIGEADAIQTDNRLYYVPDLQNNYTVALVGESSVFIERAVALREDIQIIRTTDEDRDTAAADLYIYGDSPLFFSLDADQTGIAYGESAMPEGVMVLSGKDELTSGVALSDVAVRNYRPLTGGKSLMTIDGHCVMAADSRTVALGFDIHDTNLPMKYDFPILVQNILHMLLPQNAADVGEGCCGNDVVIPIPGDCRKAYVETPSGERMQIMMMDAENEGNDDSTVASVSQLATLTLPNGRSAQLTVEAGGGVRFPETNQSGLYALTFEDRSSTDQRFFALRMPLSESDVRHTAPSVDWDGSAITFESGKELDFPLIALLLMLIMIEWVVRRRVA